MTDSTRLHVHELSGLLRAGALSSREVTSAALDAAEHGNRALNAWLTIDRDRALAEADAADSRLAGARRDGPDALSRLHPLLGVPVGSAVLRCERVTRSEAGPPVLVSLHVFPAHRTEFVVELAEAEPSMAPTGLRLVE